MPSVSAIDETLDRPVAALSVLLVHEQFPPDYKGGGEYVVLETARFLQNAGITVQVITTGDPDIKEYEGIRTQRLPVSPYRLNLEWRAIRDAGRDVDIIHAFTYHALIPARRAAKALHKPVVCGVLALFGSAWRDMRGSVIGRAFEWLERMLIRMPFDARIYLSDFSLELARNLGISDQHDVVIEPGISLKDYSAGKNKDYVMFAGKMDVRKGIDVVLEVASQLPNIPFKLVGWGEDFNRIAQEALPNVTVEPFIDRRNLCRTLADARIFLFPTKAETFGLVVAEAMASGCAIISTSPLRFSGEKITEGNITATRDSVARLWADPELCKKYGTQNQMTARQYGWPQNVDKLINVYRSAIQEHRAQGSI